MPDEFGFTPDEDFGFEPDEGSENARQALLNTPTSRASMAAHGQHRRLSEGPPDLLTALTESLGSAGEEAMKSAKGLWHLGTTSPEKLGPELYQAEKARQADITKRASESTPLGSAALQAERVPIIGPIAAGVVDLAGKGLYGTHKEFAGALARETTPLAIGGIAGKVGKGAARQVSEAGQSSAAIDEVAKALGATKASQLESLTEAHPVIHHELAKAGAVYDKIGTEGYLRGTKAAEKSLFKEEFEPNLQKFGHNLEPVSPVAERIRSSISEGTGEVRPGLKDAIDKTANRYQDKHWSLNKIYETQKELRKEIDGINSAPNRAELLGKPTNAAKLKELDALTDIMTDRLSALSGKDFSKARYRYKALKDTEEMARNANDRVATMDAAERATKHPLATDLLNAKGVYEAGAKLVKRTVAKKLADPNHPNALIGSSLKRLGGKSRRPDIAAAKGQAEIPYTGQGIEQSSVEGQGPLFNQPQSKFAGPERMAKEQKFASRKQAEEGYTPLPSTNIADIPEVTAVPYQEAPRKPYSRAALPPARSIQLGQSPYEVEHPYLAESEQFRQLSRQKTPKALPPARSTTQPSRGAPIEGRAAGAEPIKLGPTKQYQGPTPIVEHPPEEGIRLPEHGGAYGPTGSSKITPPSLRQRLKNERGSFSRKPINPDDPYAGQGSAEPQMSMEGYMSLNNISPEAQRFLGYRKTLPSGPNWRITKAKNWPGMGEGYDLLGSKHEGNATFYVQPHETLEGKIAEKLKQFGYTP